MALAKTELKLEAAEKRRVNQIVKILDREYPDARCSLDFRTPFELLLATILSAQCTDERVNQVTPVLFSKYPDAQSLAKADLKQIETIIRSTGFYKNKALAIKECAQELVKNHKGKVPADRDALMRLRGVGRKTANVVLGNCFGQPGITVDTHVGRVSRRMGLTQAESPDKVEIDLMKVVPEKIWTHFSHLLIFHGRAICTGRKAYCDRCPIAAYCPKIGIARELK